MISSLLTFKASIKKGLILIFTGLMVQVVSFTMGSCMICNDRPVEVKLDGIIMEAQRITGIVPSTTFLGRDTYQTEILQSHESIRYDSLSLAVSNELRFAYLPASNIISSAYACDPATHYSFVESVTLTSDADYNALYPAGSNLINILVNRKYGIVQAYENIQAGFYLDQPSFFLTFEVPPTTETTHNFQISYQLEDRIVTTSLENVTIRP